MSNEAYIIKRKYNQAQYNEEERKSDFIWNKLNLFDIISLSKKNSKISNLASEMSFDEVIMTLLK